jgi:hypothetical protein
MWGRSSNPSRGWSPNRDGGSTSWRWLLALLSAVVLFGGVARSCHAEPSTNSAPTNASSTLESTTALPLLLQVDALLTTLEAKLGLQERQATELRLNLTALGVSLTASEQTSALLSEQLQQAQTAQAASQAALSRLQTSLDKLTTLYADLSVSLGAARTAASETVANAERAIKAANRRALGWAIGGGVAGAGGVGLAVYVLGRLRAWW